jgi:hypothetical protein
MRLVISLPIGYLKPIFEESPASCGSQNNAGTIDGIDQSFHIF